MAATNPFDPTVKTDANQAAVPQPGLISSAMSNAGAPATANNVAQATGANYTGTGYDATKAAQTDWNVDKNQTVAGQLENVINKGSPLLDKAQADAAQTANGRGLLNSAMAAGAGTSALLDKALQIATPDANTYASSASTNAASKNANEQFNANASNTANQYSAGAKNTSDQFNAQTNTTTSLANANAQNSANTFDAQGRLDAAKTEYQGALQTALTNSTEANKVVLANMDASIKSSLADIEARFKTQMQTSQSSATMYSDTMKSIGAIMTNPDLDGPAKQAAINQQMAALQNGLNLQMGISNIQGIAELIGNMGSGVSNAPGTPNPAPAPPPQTAPPAQPPGVYPPGVYPDLNGGGY